MSGLEEAIELLKKLPGYKDADNLSVKASEGCKEIENRNNRIYDASIRTYEFFFNFFVKNRNVSV